MKSQTFRRFAAALIILLCRQVAAQRTEEPRKFYLKESTFHAFAYPNGTLDSTYTDLMIKSTRRQFADADSVLLESYVTSDNLRSVVIHYAKLCGHKFTQNGNFFSYIFSEIEGQPATRIEIYPMEIGRVHREFWPTRVNLVFIRKTITAGEDKSLSRTIEELRERIDAYCYHNGQLNEPVAHLAWQEYGPDAEVYIVDTADDFESVHRYFRRLYGAFYVRMAMDGDLFTRDFEIDLSHALKGTDADKDLILRVEENPLYVDRDGNTLLYRGHVFLKYVFWKKSKEEINQMRRERGND